MDIKNMSVKDFAEMLKEHGMELPYEESMETLKKSLTVGDKTIANRICIQPLEGYDSKSDGSPSELVNRRYRRFANSGAGLVWFESAAVAEDGKSNPDQMMLSKEKLSEFAALIEEMDKISLERFGYKQYKILQLTHSGRLSRANDWKRKPLAARLLNTDADRGILASDERIHRLIEEMTEHAVMAKEAGFDAVDVKACHGYFLSELLAAHEREGEFGGSFENRTKSMLKIIDGIRERAGEGFGIAVRLNAYDSIPQPYGWCLKEEDCILKPDLTEVIKLCDILKKRGVRIINISASQPRQSLFALKADETSRPYSEAYDLFMAVKNIKSRVNGVEFVCTGLSQFKQFGPAIGAGGIREGCFDLAGFGRQALAYPEFAAKALNGELPDADKCCILCGSCFRLMDPGLSAAGCAVRDPDPYAAFYRKNVTGRK
ncbi:MAG: NADH:flavin oxidoreductase [Lachnospiraceae bacterium]|nr:NADH:flavin oxidoreductase [Lachnospiraceae bacterium]